MFHHFASEDMRSSDMPHILCHGVSVLVADLIEPCSQSDLLYHQRRTKRSDVSAG